jgi:antitoxin VapB
VRKTLAEAAVAALRERQFREAGRIRSAPPIEEILRIGARCAALPVLDARPADEIVEYDQRGLPGR